MLTSIRLTYKLLTDDDFNLYFDLFSDDAVMQYAYLPKLENREDAVNRFRDVLDDQTDQRKGNMYVALTEETGEPVGVVDYELYQLNEDGGVAEIGYFLLQEYWGKGYGVEMAQAMVDDLFNETAIHRICASCQAENKASEQIMRKLSMTCEGVHRNTRYKDGQWYDEVKYAILRDEWLKTHTVTKKTNILMFG